MKNLQLTLAMVLGVFITAAHPAGAVTLTFDELPLQPVDGLTFMGVTFDFKIGGFDSLDANYGSGGPGSIVFLQDPSLEGNAAGVLTLDFAQPVWFLQFGVALSTFASVSPGFAVELFDASLISLGAFPVDTAPLLTFAEGPFTYFGAPVSRATIGFHQAAADRFALDNLTYEPVPEPATLLMLGSGLLGIVMRRGRPRH